MSSERDQDESTIVEDDDDPCCEAFKPTLRHLTNYVVFSIMALVLYAVALLVVELNDYPLYASVAQFTQWAVVAVPYFYVYVALALLALYAAYAVISTTPCSMRSHHYDQLQ